MGALSHCDRATSWSSPVRFPINFTLIFITPSLGKIRDGKCGIEKHGDEKSGHTELQPPEPLREPLRKACLDSGEG